MSDQQQSEKPEVRIEDWTSARGILVGKVYGHPRHPDGQRVQTSLVVRRIDDDTIETKNTIYKLGERYRP